MSTVKERVSADTIRVSVRELSEVTRWAFVAAGCSAGEAAVAGRVVQLAEVLFGCGVDAAVLELRNHRFSAQPIRRLPGPVETIDDEHGRGLLTIGPLVAGLASSRGPSGGVVVIRNISWHPVIAAIIVEALQSSRTSVRSLAAWQLPGSDARLAVDRFHESGRVEGCSHGRYQSHGAIAEAGSLVIEPFDPRSIRQPIDLTLADAGRRGGVAFAPVSPSAGSTPSSFSGVDRADGVHVDRSDWTFLYEAAKRFLVIDS